MNYIDWNTISRKHCDPQVDIVGKAIVIDYPFNAKDIDGRPLEICVMIATAIAELEIPEGTIRIRLQETPNAIYACVKTPDGIRLQELTTRRRYT